RQPGRGRSAFELSIGVFVEEAFEDGEENDFQVQPEGPAADVVEVVFDAFLHLVEGVGFAAPAVDLGPAGDAGLDLVAEHVAADELAVLLIVGDGVGAGADDGHVAAQHIEKLRELVQGGAAQKGAEWGDAAVVALGLGNGVAVFHDGHAAEFPDLDGAAVHAVAFLPEQRWPGGSEAHAQGDDQHGHGNDRENDQRQHYVLDTFDQPAGAIHGRVEDADAGQAVDGFA